MIRRAPRLPRGPLGKVRAQLPTQGKAHDEFVVLWLIQVETQLQLGRVGWEREEVHWSSH